MILIRALIFICVLAIGIVIAPIIAYVKLFGMLGTLWRATEKKAKQPDPGPAPVVKFTYPPEYSAPGVEWTPRTGGGGYQPDHGNLDPRNPPTGGSGVPEPTNKASMRPDDWTHVSILRWDKEGNA